MADNRQYKVAAYLRLAREDSEVIEVQKDKVLRYVVEQGYGAYDEIPVFADNGYSGSNFNRIAFTKMNTAISDGGVNMVIVQSIDRVGRNIFEVASWLEEMKRKSVVVKAVDGSYNLTMNPTMEFIHGCIEKMSKSPSIKPISSKGGAQHGS